MRKLYLLPAAASFTMLIASTPLSAQESSASKLEKLEDPTPPTITIRQPSTEGAKITEEREGGAVKKVKVKSGGSTYYLKPKGAKSTPPMDAHESETSVPQWVVKEFDAGKEASPANKSVISDSPPSSAPTK